MRGWRWEPPWEHSRGCNILCRELGIALSALPQPAQILPRRSCPREGDPGRIWSPRAQGLSLGWKRQLEAPLFCSLIKMIFIIKSRKPGWLLWMKHWLILCTRLWENCHWSRDHSNLCLSHRQRLLTVLLYIRLVRCWFQQLPKYIKRSSAHGSQRLKKVIVTVLTKEDFNNH